MKVSKNKKEMRFFLMSQGSHNKNLVPMSQGVLCSPRTDTHRHIGTHTHTQVNTEDTLSGFQKCFLQPIIKDRSNITFLKNKKIQ